MELKQLNYFLAAVRSGSLSKAAMTLAVEQPALSRSLRALESELGAKLFHRHGRGVQLTDRGREFHETIWPLVDRLDEVCSHIRSSAPAIEGPITLGLPSALSSALAVPVTRSFATRLPQAMLRLVTSYSGHLSEWLANGQLDLALLNNADLTASIPAETLCRVELLHVAHRELVPPNEWPDPTVSFKAALSLPLVLPSPGHGLRRQLARIARDKRIVLEPMTEIDSLELTKELARNRVAAAILPYPAIIRETADPELIVRQIVEPDIGIDYSLAFAPDRPVGASVSALARSIRAELRRAAVEGLISASPARRSGHLEFS